MSFDLKPYYDAVNTANVKVLEIANAMNVLYEQGTDEGKAEALKLRPALDEAQKNAEDSKALYESLKKATSASNVADNFIPASQTSATPDEEQPSGVMKRAEWNALDYVNRMTFIKGGGKLED